MLSKYCGLHSQLNEVKRFNFIHSHNDGLESFQIKTLMYENITDICNLDNSLYNKKYYEWVETLHLENYSLDYSFSINALTNLTNPKYMPRLKNLSISFCKSKNLLPRETDLKHVIRLLLIGRKITYLKVSCANLMSFFT